MPISKLALTSALVTSLLALPAIAAAQSEGVMAAQVRVLPIQSVASGKFDALTPKTQTKKTRLDYGVWDEALKHAVIYLGPSTRRHMGRPDPLTGTRFVSGHRSAYRLEGSRVRFSEFDDDYKTAISDYRKDLERVADQVDITQLAKNEQLAFWLNLHNAALIEQISQNYPKQYPSDIEIGGVKLHDAKVITVKGTALSLRDIRENIVYPNWSSPMVIYGFFLGDIGGPMIQNYAFTGENVNTHLGYNAEEFVNSLRGAHEASKNVKVSRIYNDVRQFYFPNFEQDVLAHLLTHARPDVAEDLRSGKSIKIDRYDRVAADMEGGERARIARFQVTNDSGQPVDVNASSYRYLKELDTKFQVLKKRKLVGTGTVTVEDVLPTIDIGALPGTTSDAETPSGE